MVTVIVVVLARGETRTGARDASFHFVLVCVCGYAWVHACVHGCMCVLDDNFGSVILRDTIYFLLSLCPGAYQLG